MKKIVYILLVLVTSFSLFTLLRTYVEKEQLSDAYIKGSSNKIVLLNDNFEEVDTINRGTKLKVVGGIEVSEDKRYKKVLYNDTYYFVEEANVTSDIREVVEEKKMYIRTPVSVYESLDSSHLISHINKGSEVEILDFDKIKENGMVNKYKIKYNDIVGYIYGKYTVSTKEEAESNYDSENTYLVHASRGNTNGGGSAANLDYFPVEKPSFENNVMPEEVRSLYLNGGVLGNIDKYIEIAKQSNINAFVVDIKDNTAPAYASIVMEKYSKTNYDKAINSAQTYKNVIQKLKDNNFYVIGRITVFKDNYYAIDHPENTIIDKRTGKPFEHNKSYWPSAYNRDVWEFNVELAKEAVTLMGFNEIQFDYVRFPDRTSSELESNLDFQNKYGEEKAEAIQNFLFYATDEIHELGAYVSVDVFGESAHNYVSGYGQYWGAISNVVDVIGGMPYPDHFNKYQYNFNVPVWTVPYELLSYWAKNYVVKQQALIPTPAIVRTWIQTYDVSKTPRTNYDADMVSKEIQALYDSGLTGGFITWNAGSSISKYTELIPAFNKNYKGSD